MDAPDRPLAASQDALRAFADWGEQMRSRLAPIVQDRSVPGHQQVAAAHLLRLPHLCSAIRLLNDARLFEEAVTLVRVMAELAINVDWVGTDDSRAWSLALDLSDAEDRGDELRKEHFGVEVDREATPSTLPPGVKLPPRFAERVKQASTDSKALYAGVYQWASGPTHNAVASVVRLVDEGTRDTFGRRFAGLAVQSARFLAVNGSRTLGINEGHDRLQRAIDAWASARPSKT